MKELSIFIDESGDFGKFSENSPFYIVSFVFHEQQYCINNQVDSLNEFLENKGLKNHTIHTAPLIRREQIYKDWDVNLRYKIFYKLFTFTRNCNIKYTTAIVEKHLNTDNFEITKNLTKQISNIIKENYKYFTQFDNIIVYYDNGQYQLTQILVAIFNALLSVECDFRQVLPSEYKLFQTADLLCTLTLLKSKIEKHKKLTKSETIFFGSIGKLRKTYLKYLDKILLK